MIPLTHKAAIANIPENSAGAQIPKKHRALTRSSSSQQLDSWMDAQLELLTERFASFQTNKSVKQSMGR